MLRILLLILLLPVTIWAQQSPDYGVQVWAEVQANPPRIKVIWTSAGQPATGYTIYRKLKSEQSWGIALGAFSDTTFSYTDNNVLVGEEYEYRIVRSGPSYTGYGYINSGIEIPAKNILGKIVLVIDTTHLNALSMEIDRLEQDMNAEGWQVIRVVVSPNDAVGLVKSKIKAHYLADTAGVRSVFLLGHVPVPYSGNLAPDGHIPDHQGAWPADVYYGDMDTIWRDSFISSTVASQTRHHNIPGDGKFDESLLSSDVELEVGRVDFYNMPAFGISETEMLRRYLDKNHAYRTRQFQPLYRCLIDDNFQGFNGEAFGASAWKNFAPLLGTDSIYSSIDYFPSLRSDSYIWSYGCGGGSYTSCGGVGNTTNFVNDSVQGIFTMLFGSYFGDWDSQNNLLRAAIGSGTMLASFWSGIPHAQFHHMGLGETIGYGVRLTQNNSSTYFGNYGYRFVHIALMGDPTLRMYIIDPPKNLSIATSSEGASLSWTASNDPVLGYNVYRKDSVSDWVKVNMQPITTNAYFDSCLVAGSYQYLVKAIRLEVTPSGSFYNLSPGIFGSAIISDENLVAQFFATVAGDTLFVNNTSVGGLAYE